MSEQRAVGWQPTVARLLWNALGSYRSRPCIVGEGYTLSYEQVKARVGARATWLQRNTSELGHVGILLRNSQHYIEWILACACAGRVRVPLNVLDPVEVQHFKLEHAEIELLVTSEEWRETLGRDGNSTLCVDATGYEQTFDGYSQQPEIRSAPARYRLSFTGGTTGVPKAVVETDVQELAMMRNLLLEVSRPGPGTVYIGATPMSHAAGAFVVPTALAGGALSWIERFDPERLLATRWLGDGDGGDYEIETFVVPTALGTLAEAAGSATHRRLRAFYGGAACPPGTLEAAVAALDGRLVQVYGQAEVPMTIAVLKEHDHADLERVAGAAGRSFIYADVSIEDNDGARLPDGEIGEIVVRGEHTMAGYWNNEAATREKQRGDGAVLTNDRGYFDEYGLLRIVGRSRDLIISGGFNVYPSDVESRLGGVSGVDQLLVFGIPHSHWGEAVILGVVTEGDRHLQPELDTALRERAQERLATFERPKAIVHLQSVPLTAVGKPHREKLSEMYVDQANAALAEAERGQ